MTSALGLIRVIPNSELVKQEEREAARQAAYENNMKPSLQGLAKYVMECWEDARDAKNAVLPRMQRAQRARLGQYDTVKLAQIREFGGSEEYARITANKCRVVEAWLRDVFMGQTDKPWTLNATPKPDFPPDVTAEVKNQIAMEAAAIYAQTGQMPDPMMVRSAMADQMDQIEERLRDAARKAVMRMEHKMEDQLVQGGFTDALAAFIADMTTYPSAILKGPVLRRKKILTWKNTEGATAPVVEDVIGTEFERIDPFRAYPAPGATTPQDGFFIEHQTFSYQDLYDLIGSPGFNEEAIRAVLAECDRGGFSDWLGFLNEKEDSVNDAAPRNLRRKVFNIDCLEFNGPVKGADLIEWGLDEDVDDADATYEACVWLIGSWVIKAQLNYDPLGQRPYYKTSYEELPGDFWGFGIPDVLDDMEGIANAAVRSLVNNMAMASGPQVAINIDRLPAGEDITNLHPWKIWQVQESQFGSSAPAIDFFQPNTNVRELLEVLERAYQMADDFSLVPRYMAGSDKVGGAGRTASGLSMLMDAANKGLKGVVSNIDQRIIKPLLEKLYAHNMMYEQDETMKGDAQVMARGAVSLMQLESLQLRRNEFLQVTANPIDSQIVGLPGRAEVLREVARGLELDVNKIVPPREQMEAMMAQQQQAAQAAQGAPGGAPQQQQPKVGSNESLQNGAAVTDNFSQNSMTP